MRKDDAQFPDLVLDELAKRLVEDPDPADLMPGQPLEALRATCAIDALADHLDIQLTDADVTAQMPGNDAEQKERIRQQLEDQGLGDEARCSPAARPPCPGWSTTLACRTASRRRRRRMRP